MGAVVKKQPERERLSGAQSGLGQVKSKPEPEQSQKVSLSARKKLIRFFDTARDEMAYYDLAHPFIDTIVTSIFETPMRVALKPARTARGKIAYLKAIRKLEEAQMKSKSKEENRELARQIGMMRERNRLTNIYEFREKETVRWTEFLNSVYSSERKFKKTIKEELKKCIEEKKLQALATEKRKGFGSY